MTSTHKTITANKDGLAVLLRLRPTYLTIPAGYCLRLSIQSASFPAFPVNPGTGARPQDASVTDRLVTTLMLRSGDGYPSVLRLPMLSQATAGGTAS